jgi:outer membrane protein TolC
MGPKRIPSSSRWFLAAAALAACAAGCASTDLPPDVTDQIAQATGNPEPVKLEVDGAPLDVDAAPGEVLGLEEALRRAMAHGPELQEALARVRAAQADVLQAKLLPNPVLRVVLRFPESGGSPEIQAELAAEVISLLKRPGQISAAESRLRATAASAVSTALDIVAEVQARYAAVQALDEHLRILEERLGIVERLAQLARDRLDLGEGTRLDVLTFETRRTELQAEITDRQLEDTEERLVLARLLGQPSGGTGWRLAAWESGGRADLPESRWVALALEMRPEVQAQKYQLEALGVDLSVAKFAPFTEVHAGAEGERTDGDWAVGPSLSTPVPLFDFGQARRERARAAVIEARHKLTGARRQVVEEVRRAHAALTASRENLQRVRGQLIPAAELRYAQAEAQFRAGQTDVTALLLAEEELHSARNRLVQVERRNAEALFRLERAVGGPGAASRGAAPEVDRSPEAQAQASVTTTGTST